MNADNRYSDELINAFVDGELTHEERVELLESATLSDSLKQRICDAQYLKERVQDAYPETIVAEHDPRRRRFFGHAIAAVAGGVSVLTGLRVLDKSEPGVVSLAESKPELQHNQSRVVFHISSDDTELADELLNQVEIVLQDYAINSKPIRVDVVANNEGLRLLQLGRSPFPERIRKLDEKYQNLMFAACGNTIDRFRKRFDEPIEILPEAVIIHSGISFVARRQQQGWSYIKA